MSDEPTARAEEQDEAPLADDELDGVSGGKILNRANVASSEGDAFENDVLAVSLPDGSADNAGTSSSSTTSSSNDAGTYDGDLI